MQVPSYLLNSLANRRCGSNLSVSLNLKLIIPNAILSTSCTYTVYPKKYAHGFCFAVLCCGYTLTDFPISIRLTSLALWQSNDCPSASKATLMNLDKYFMWIHYERLHNHNKAKHNKTVCIFLGIYCSLKWVPQKPTDNSTLLQVTAWSRAVEMLVWACVGCRNINQLIFQNGYSAPRRIYYLDFKSVHRLVLFWFDLIIFKMDVCDLLAHILHDCITVTP